MPLDEINKRGAIRERLDSQMECARFGRRHLDRLLETRWDIRLFMPRMEICQGAQTDCHHIDLIKANPSYGDHPFKRIVLANVREVTQGENDVLLTPLIPLGDLHFGLTVACDLARLGASPQDVARYLHGNRIRVAQDYISQHGRKIYGPWSEQRRCHEGYEIVPQTAALTY